MTGTITLSDDGQNYIEFDLVCGVIEAVRPSGLRGWKGTKVLNTEFVVGGLLQFDLQWRPFNPTLEQPITRVEFTEYPAGEWVRANMSSEKTLYACPRGGDDREMYDVDCAGLPFYFECVNEAVCAAAAALLNVNKIPAVLLEDVDGVMLIDTIKPGRPQTIADIGNGFVVIYDNNIVDYGIITHEATHAWAKDKWGSVFPPADTDYMAVVLGDEPPITSYAGTDAAEDLAEAVRYYAYSPAFLKAQCPLRYAIVERMMTDPSYYG